MDKFLNKWKQQALQASPSTNLTAGSGISKKQPGKQAKLHELAKVHVLQSSSRNPKLEEIIQIRTDLEQAVARTDEAELLHQLQRLACYELTHELLVASQIGAVVRQLRESSHEKIARVSSNIVDKLRKVVKRQARMHTLAARHPNNTNINPRASIHSMFASAPGASSQSASNPATAANDSAEASGYGYESIAPGNNVLGARAVGPGFASAAAAAAATTAASGDAGAGGPGSVSAAGSSATSGRGNGFSCRPLAGRGAGGSGMGAGAGVNFAGASVLSCYGDSGAGDLVGGSALVQGPSSQPRNGALQYSMLPLSTASTFSESMQHPLLQQQQCPDPTNTYHPPFQQQTSLAQQQSYQQRHLQHTSFAQQQGSQQLLAQHMRTAQQQGYQQQQQMSMNAAQQQQQQQQQPQQVHTMAQQQGCQQAYTQVQSQQMNAAMLQQGYQQAAQPCQPLQNQHPLQ